jgi:sialate O-acetylesterase
MAIPSGGQRRSSHYNIVVHPLIPYAIRGTIWYQGESNIGDHMIYKDKMRALINGWRSEWAQGDFPFYYVQLTPWRSRVPLGLPKIWEAQAAALAIPKTGLIPTSDTSDMELHPANKQDIGIRLGNMALAKTYGHKDIVCEGPRFSSMKREGKSLVITFDTGGGKLASREDKPLSHFIIAGADRAFVPATAVISSDNTVTVTCDQVTEPAAVRFGWENEAQPNVMNSAGLPAYPFRTDDWHLEAE